MHLTIISNHIQPHSGNKKRPSMEQISKIKARSVFPENFAIFTSPGASQVNEMGTKWE